MTREQIDYKSIKEVILKKGYKFFEGEFNINIVGIRTNNRQVDNWDDYICFLYQENGENKIWISSASTTDPGIYYMTKKLLNPNGCAALVPGQYRGMWKIGKHGVKQYEAFVQVGKCKVYRDRNKDNFYDFNKESIDEGYFGINQHHGYDSKNVGANSAGCQVHKLIKDLNIALTLAKKNTKAGHGDTFTYTLLTEEDFK